MDRSTLLKRIGLGLAVFLGSVFLLLVLIKVGFDTTYYKGYNPSAPLNIEVKDAVDKGEFTRTHFYYSGNRGERVPALMVTPNQVKRPMPCVIFLHGIGQSKSFLDDICPPFLKAGYAFVSFDQYTRGERKLKNGKAMAALGAFRVRPAYTINDTRRLVDYLVSRSDIDPARIYLAGASYGAITGATASALDKRIAAVALIYGGGSIPALASAREFEKEFKGWMPLVKLAGWYFLGAADPARYVAGISPRPVLILNGEDDGMIADKAARTLQAAAKEPKEIKWYKGDHIGLDEATVWKVMDDVIAFFKKQEPHS